MRIQHIRTKFAALWRRINLSALNAQVKDFEDSGAREASREPRDGCTARWVGSGKKQWLSCSRARDTLSTLLHLPQQSFQISLGPLKTAAGAVTYLPESHKQGYRGGNAGDTFLPSPSRSGV